MSEPAWGLPKILDVLKDLLYLDVLRKAQKELAEQHLKPWTPEDEEKYQSEKK